MEADEQSAVDTDAVCVTELGDQYCALEPLPHPVHLVGCRDDDDCPIGSICSPCHFDNAGRTIGASCIVPEVYPSRPGELQRGFGVPSFPQQRLTMTASGNQALEWEAPSGTRIVSCALFTCPPSFERHAIRNAYHCMVSYNEYGSRSGTFDAANPNFVLARALEDGPEECRGKFIDSRQVVATLLVGCWAYDDWDLIAATDLFTVRSQDVFLDNEALPSNPDGSCGPSEIKSCELASGTFGFCDPVEKACRPRCLSSSECPEGCLCNPHFWTDETTDETTDDTTIKAIGLGTCHCETP